MLRSFGALSTGVLAGAAAASGSVDGRLRVSGQGRLVCPAPVEGDAAGATGASGPGPVFAKAGAVLAADGAAGAGKPDMGTGAIRAGGLALGAQLEHPDPETAAGMPHAPP